MNDANTMELFSQINSNSKKIRRRNDSLGKNMQNSFNNPPIAFNISINNNIVTAPNATIVNSSSNQNSKKLNNKLQSKYIAQIPQTIKKPRHLYQASDYSSNSKIINKPDTLTLLNSSQQKQDNQVLTPLMAIKFYGNCLTDFEKGEILDYREIYFLGKAEAKKQNMKPPFDIDDSHGYYNVSVGDHIGYRYEVLKLIGKGSFGQAFKCFDHKEKTEIALKLIRSKKKLFHQGTVEVKILKHIKINDPEHKSCIIRILDSFVFRNHIVNLNK